MIMTQYLLDEAGLSGAAFRGLWPWHLGMQSGKWGTLAVFNLSDDTMARLTAKFKEFQADRETIRSLLDDYVADYRRFEGTKLARQEYLREKYAKRAPCLSHLAWDEEAGLLWGAADIAILLGRDRSSVTRVLSKMERSEAWRARLFALRKLVRESGSAPIHVYGRGVFDLIVDYYEEEYLRRFTEPRRGIAADADTVREIRRFWSCLKAAERTGSRHSLVDAEPPGLPEVPPMGWGEALRLIFSRVFSLRTGTLFAVLFALGYELSRRWSFLYLWLPAAAVLVFLICLPILRRGRLEPSHVASLAAGALLFCLLWLVGLLSSDGTVHTLGRTISVRPLGYNLVLDPQVLDSGRVRFVITTDAPDAAQFHYRISPDVEFRSTGSLPQTNPATGVRYPDPTIDAGRPEGAVALEVKYADARGTEHGPYPFAFDLDTLRLQAGKDFVLGMKGGWVTVHRLGGTTFVETVPPILADVARRAVSGITYGVNTEIPDVEISLEGAENLEHPGGLLQEDADEIEFVSSRLLFRDGTSSDVRISRITY